MIWRACSCRSHRLKESQVPHELVDRYIQQMKDDIAKDEDFDAADALDAQKRTLLTIAEGANANSRLSKVVYITHKLTNARSTWLRKGKKL